MHRRRATKPEQNDARETQVRQVMWGSFVLRAILLLRNVKGTFSSLDTLLRSPFRKCIQTVNVVDIMMNCRHCISAAESIIDILLTLGGTCSDTRYQRDSPRQQRRTVAGDFNIARDAEQPSDVWASSPV